jgi:hypothetical protein
MRVVEAAAPDRLYHPVVDAKPHPRSGRRLTDPPKGDKPGFVQVVEDDGRTFLAVGDGALGFWKAIEEVFGICLRKSGTNGSNPVPSSGESRANLTFGANPRGGSSRFSARTSK